MCRLLTTYHYYRTEHSINEWQATPRTRSPLVGSITKLESWGHHQRALLGYLRNRIPSKFRLMVTFWRPFSPSHGVHHPTASCMPCITIDITIEAFCLRSPAAHPTAACKSFSSVPQVWIFTISFAAKRYPNAIACLVFKSLPSTGRIRR